MKVRRKVQDRYAGQEPIEKRKEQATTTTIFTGFEPINSKMSYWLQRGYFIDKRCLVSLGWIRAALD